MQAKNKTLHISFLLLIIIGILLSIYNFFDFRSLWRDEAMLAVSIVNKPALELLQPLDYNQIAPIGFLMVEKLFASLFSNTDWSLRIFPMLLFFSSIYLFHQLSKRIIDNRNFAWFATSFFTLSFYMIRYSSEVKQYMADTSFALLILLATLIAVERHDKKSLVQYALVGAIAIWFSNVSVILLFTSGLYFASHSLRNKERYSRILLPLISWAVSFAVYFLFFIHDHPTQDFMLEYWSTRGGFLPKNLLSGQFYSLLFYHIKTLFSMFAYDKLSIVFLPVFFLGTFFIFKKNKGYLYLLLSPLILHFVLSYFKLYPFGMRLTLYFYPILVIGITYAFLSLYTQLKPNVQQRAAFLLILPLLVQIALVFMRGIPTDREEIKEPLAYVNSNISQEEQLYVYYGGIPSFEFYKPLYPNVKALPEDDILLGQTSFLQWDNYQQDIDLISRDVWILFSHTYWIPNENKQFEDQYILGLFEANGYQIVDSKIYEGCSVYKASQL